MAGGATSGTQKGISIKVQFGDRPGPCECVDNDGVVADTASGLGNSRFQLSCLLCGIEFCFSLLAVASTPGLIRNLWNRQSESGYCVKPGTSPACKCYVIFPKHC